jgi:hypothetical protein
MHRYLHALKTHIVVEYYANCSRFQSQTYANVNPLRNCQIYKSMVVARFNSLVDFYVLAGEGARLARNDIP